MNETERAVTILTILEKQYPMIEGTVLNWKTPLDLLIATILSAQSTDKQINKITPELFKKYKTPSDYVNTPKEELEEIIKSSGFFHRKTELIQSACKQIINDFDGKVPNNMSDLLKLKGVARKTANIILGNAYGIVEGIAVDTHVMRLSQRLGFSIQKNRDKIELDLTHLFPKNKWYEINYLLISHGRAICTAKNPNCKDCSINKLCPSAFKFKKYEK